MLQNLSGVVILDTGAKDLIVSGGLDVHLMGLPAVPSKTRKPVNPDCYLRHVISIVTRGTSALLVVLV